MTKINHEEYEVLKALDDKWGWIARDKNRCLYVFTGKPVKKYGPLLYWGTEGFLSFELFDEKDLFQFIQWEDREPYNIAELIREYEGEKTEVKNIEWLKAQICTEMMYLDHIRKERWSGVKYQTLRSVAQKINQLDETEVLSQKWIDEHSFSLLDGYPWKKAVLIDDLQNLLVPKQELPVIPKYVAKYLEFAKSDVSLMRVMVVAYSRDELPEWEKEYDWISANDEAFARAWLNGYEVEEQKYYAKLKEIQPLEGEWLTNLSGPNYYALDTKGLMLGEFILDLVGIKTEASTHTLKDWERYGINDSNAEFVRVDE